MVHSVDSHIQIILVLCISSFKEGHLTSAQLLMAGSTMESLVMDKEHCCLKERRSVMVHVYSWCIQIIIDYYSYSWCYQIADSPIRCLQ